jgi:hypothetical protein
MSSHETRLRELGIALPEVFGEAGRHVRTSAGVASLPMGFAASVYMIVEVE